MRRTFDERQIGNATFSDADARPWCAAGGAEMGRINACEAACAISFAELVPNRARYEGQNINIDGILALMHGRLALQPSREAYLSATGDVDTIQFYIPASAQREIMDAHLDSYVSVSGTFTVSPAYPIVGIGYFGRDVDVQPLITRMVSEGIDQWRVPIEHLD